MGPEVADEIERRPVPEGIGSIGRDKVKRVAILTSALGMGHVRAAQAIQAALLGEDPGLDISIIDFWSLMDAGVADAAKERYLTLATRHPRLYQAVFQLDAPGIKTLMCSSQNLPPVLFEGFRVLGSTSLPDREADAAVGNRIDRLLFRLLVYSFPGTTHRIAPDLVALIRLLVIVCGRTLLVRRLTARLRRIRPDVLVTTQALPAGLLSLIHDVSRLPTLSILADFGANRFQAPSAEYQYCVPHESIANLHVLPSYVVTGLPLMPDFEELPDQAAARGCLGLDLTIPVVLVQGGGLGLHVVAITDDLLRLSTRMQLLVQVGNDSRAFDALRRIAESSDGRLIVKTWTDAMHVFIRAADLVVGKPGGLTLAECLACGRPLIACSSVNGQESFNAEFIERNQVGKVVQDGELGKVIESLLEDPKAIAAMQQRAAKFGDRRSARTIAKLILNARNPLAAGARRGPG